MVADVASSAEFLAGRNGGCWHTACLGVPDLDRPMRRPRRPISTPIPPPKNGCLMWFGALMILGRLSR